MELVSETIPPALTTFFAAHPRLALAFSGGCDSTFLLWCGLSCGADVRAYLLRTPFESHTDLNGAVDTALTLGANLTILPENLLDRPAISANQPDRCYHCKTVLFTRLRSVAALDDRTILIDGTNASDDPVLRPGMRALAELGVISPLRDAGLTKKEIRQRSQNAGLPTWDMPSNSCLATRIPTGTPLTAADLARTERAEAAIAALGLKNFRVRLRDGVALIQTQPEQDTLLAKLKPRITELLAADYRSVTYGYR